MTGLFLLPSNNERWVEMQPSRLRSSSSLVYPPETPRCLLPYLSMACPILMPSIFLIPRCWERICLPRINYLTLATLLYDNGLGWCVSALHTCTGEITFRRDHHRRPDAKRLTARLSSFHEASGDAARPRKVALTFRPGKCLSSHSR